MKTDDYGGYFSKGIEILFWPIAHFFDLVALVIGLLGFLGFGLLMLPIVGIGWIGTKLGFRSQWWPGR